MQAPDGTASELQIGQRVGKYVLKRKLGAGAMGVVFAGEHEALGREIAIKVLRAEFTENNDVVQRFQGEAEAVSKIGHANIVSVYDFGRLTDGAMYYVMECIAGETLSARMRRQPPMEPEEILSVFAQMCRALQATHAKGVVHRDLKPDNVMLIPQQGRPPHVKVVDFGVAKIREAARQKTAAGTVLGTPAYMAPEQITSNATVDGRADIYALGAILYVILTGKMIFEGDIMQVLMAHVRERVVPPSQRIDPSRGRPIPPAVEAVIMKSLEKNPANRQPDAATFYQELESAWGIVKRATGAMAPLDATAVTTSQPVATGAAATMLSAGAAGATIATGAQATQAVTAPAVSKSKIPMIAGLVAVLGLGGGAAAFFMRGGGGGGGGKTPVSTPTVRNPLQLEAEQVLQTALEGDALKRRAALDAMGAVGDPAATEQIVTLLGDDNPEVRRAAGNAAAAAGRAGDKALLQALADAAGRSGGAVVTDLAAARFRAGDKTAEEDLRRALDSRDPGGRLRAAVALAEADKLTPPVLKAAVDAAGPMAKRPLRQAAWNILAKTGKAELVSDLRSALAGTDPIPKLDAAQALARAGDPEAVRALVDMSKDAPDPVDRVEAALVLADIGNQYGRPALITALGADLAAVRARAATALGRLASSPVAQGDLGGKLAPLLKDADAAVRVSAAAALLATKQAP